MRPFICPSNPLFFQRIRTYGYKTEHISLYSIQFPVQFMNLDFSKFFSVSCCILNYIYMYMCVFCLSYLKYAVLSLSLNIMG
jgi:hypothetical protein